MGVSHPWMSLRITYSRNKNKISPLSTPSLSNMLNNITDKHNEKGHTVSDLRIFDVKGRLQNKSKEVILRELTLIWPSVFLPSSMRKPKPYHVSRCFHYHYLRPSHPWTSSPLHLPRGTTFEPDPPKSSTNTTVSHTLTRYYRPKAEKDSRSIVVEGNRREKMMRSSKSLKHWVKEGWTFRILTKTKRTNLKTLKTKFSVSLI